MKQMKVLVVGTGSIGRRHIANLCALGADVSAFSYRGTAGVAPLDGVRMAPDLEQALDGDLDAVVVANRTDLHIEVALKAARRKKHLFIEKPLSVSLAGCNELCNLTEANHIVVEAGFMLRFHPNLRFVKQVLSDGSLGELMHLRASVGQWLPDWRPTTDHRKGYGATRSTGGGVILDLIHELDLAQWLAGPVVDVTAMARHVDSLEIETEAIAQIGLRMESGALAQIHLDYVRPGYGRSLEIVGERGVLSWDYVTGVVMRSGSDGIVTEVHRVPADFERNCMFRDHIAHFLTRIQNPALPAASSLQESIAAMRVALACHKSAAERRCVHPAQIE